MATETKASTTQETVRYAKFVVEFDRVPVPNVVGSLLGGKTKNQYTRDQQYARFYLNAAIRKCGGRVISNT